MAGSGRDPSGSDDKENKDHAPSKGVELIDELIFRTYPDQKNHIQATAVRKFWVGGPDPLDFISILLHPGDAMMRSPPHWHYITFGFSDLHGDGRVHQFIGSEEQSGFGFELTFRLKKEKNENQAPLWPATLLNSLARYVFKTGNILNCGDHIPWEGSLNSENSSLIQHMLLSEDSQLCTLDGPFGMIQFRQVVGVMESEMKAAQRWKGNSVIDLLAKTPKAGGGLLVTDLSREQSMFDLNLQLSQVILNGIEKNGSNLGHVTSVCAWQDSHGHICSGEEENDCEERELQMASISMDMAAAELLPLMAVGRLMKGRFFVYQNVSGQVIIFVPPEFQAEMVIVNEEHPLKCQSQVLQVFCNKEYTKRMAAAFATLQQPSELKRKFSQVFEFRNPNVQINVMPRGNIPFQ